LYERNLSYNNKVYVGYVAYEKAFDRVDWTKLMTILQTIGVKWRSGKLIWNLYYNFIAYVRIGDGLSTAYTVGRGKARMFTISNVVMMKQ